MKLLKLYADWCGPCASLSKTIKTMDLVVPIEEINIDHHKEIVAKYGVRSIPALILVEEDGTEIRRLMGNQPKDQISEFIGV